MPYGEISFDNTSTSVDLLASYYNAIDRQEYQRAYGYWERPLAYRLQICCETNTL